MWQYNLAPLETLKWERFISLSWVTGWQKYESGYGQIPLNKKDFTDYSVDRRNAEG